MNSTQLLTYFDRISDAPDALPHLRRFILDLAVRGKLVEQDPNDEPAAELLRRIQAEKARLVKAGELRQGKHLPSVEPDEQSFVVPAAWKWVRLRQITSDRGQTTPDKDFTYIDVGSINKEIGVVADATILAASEAPSRARKVVKVGDVLYSCVRPYLLNIAVVDHDIIPPPIASTAFAVLNGFGLVLSKYLWVALRSSFMIECVEAKMRGQAYPAINDADFALVPFPLPPLVEQHRVVAKVDELMALCDRLEAAQAERERWRDSLAAASFNRLNQTDADAPTFREHARFHLQHLPRLTSRPDQIQQLRQTILNLAVQGKLVEQDPNDEPASKLIKRVQLELSKQQTDGLYKKFKPLPPIEKDEKPVLLPIGWEWYRLRSLVFTLGDGLHGTPEYSGGTDCYFINGNNLIDGRIVIKHNTKTVSPAEMQKHRKLMTSNTVLVSINGTLGSIAFYDNENVVLGKSACYFNLSSLVDKYFVRLVIESPYFVNYADKNATGTTIKNLGLKAMNYFPVPLPPLAEQHRIVAKVNELMALCDQMEAQLTTTQAQGRLLLEAVLNKALAA